MRQDRKRKPKSKKKFKLNRNSKTQLKPKQLVKTKKQKKYLSKKEIDVDKQGLSSLGCRGTWKESQIDWLFAEYEKWVHENCILGIYNTWYEITHLKNRLY